MNRLTTPSFELAVYAQGDPAAPKQALVLPGLLDTAGYPHMRSHVELLATKGFYALTFDPPGTWQSGGEIGDYTMSNYLTAVDELITSHDDKPTLLIGHSLGGLVAAVMAAKNSHVSAFAAIMSPNSFVQEHEGKQYVAGLTLEQWETQDTRPSDRDLPTDPSQHQHFELPFTFAKDSLQYHARDGFATAKPKLFVTGNLDPQITPSMVAGYYRAAADPKQYVELASDHDYRKNPALIQKVNEALGNFIAKFSL